MFTNNPGDGYLFNLDWVEFSDRLGSPVPLTGDHDGNGTDSAGLAGAAGNELQWMLTDRHSPGAPTQTPFPVRRLIVHAGDRRLGRRRRIDDRRGLPAHRQLRMREHPPQR